MKRLITILLAIFLFTACGDKKEEAFCWRFDKTKKWTRPSGAVQYYYSSVEQCNLTEEAAEITRKNYELTWYNGVSGNRTKVEQTATKTKITAKSTGK